ncbi:SusC/RagA family TonB-linked outer membrane protein [Xylanibacter ruminicola]|uniref:TonB-linked outer membrane protein, SusC/RagA family n=1 Tax=Xylanibacter ruminicola TaxID=839 RepID=A0A1M6VN24_XYLRU|nr:TonB-dependent receptor [Xylanibacter ruminicola]SHK82721.1 TonB-linked outer membrane protein, SusC/RagA family [Xylanibacter ruminicola]
MKRLSMMLAGLFLLAGMAMAQTKVTGTVVSFEDNEPIIGATIQAVGNASIGTITDYDGNFTLEVPEGVKTLKITYVGMEPLEVAVSTKTLKIQLKNDSQILDEVVVVAYGTQKKTSLTGSIQEVKSEAIELRPTSSVASALEGTVTGIQVNSTYGVPGQDPSIRIRGVGTVNGDTNPLYILDGVPFEGNISDLNPADIESMSVLKDAASAALYGNRASNGVILITTKKGKQGKLNVSVDIKQGTYSRGIPEYDLLPTRDWMEAQWLNMKNQRMSAGDDAATAGAFASQNLISERLFLNIFNKADDALFTADGKLVSDAQIKGTYGEDLDWYKQTIKSGYRQEYNFNANGANEKADYLMSVGYLNEQGYLKNSGFDRISARLATNIQPTKWLKTGLNVNVTHQNFDASYGTGTSGYTNPFNYCRNISPIYPVHLHDVNTGEYILDGFGQKQYDGGSYVDANGQTIVTRNQYPDRHVIWENELNQDKTTRNTINGILYADIILPYNFTFTVKGNLNLRTNSENSYGSAVIGDSKSVSGAGTRKDYRYKNYAFQQQLHWRQEYGVHSIDALLGHENYDYTYNYLSGSKHQEVVPGLNNLKNFTNPVDVNDYNETYHTESYLGRVRYGYDNRYNIEASFRRDGSSKFAKHSRWGNFWSCGANWVISNEKFMRKYDWVNYLKLRADYGEVGNDAGTGYYGYMALYNPSKNDREGAFWIAQLPNEDLKWETGQSWGIAVDGRLFNKLNFSIEYFDKRNKDLIFNVYNPLSAGATSTTSAESTITRNLGTISNRGFEFSADMDVFKTKEWKINVGANVTFVKNKIVKLPEQNKNGIIDGTKKIVEGKDRYSFYTYTWEGINTKNGLSLYKFNDDDYFFSDGTTTYGNKDGKQITGNDLNAVVVINGVPYSYLTTYGKREFHGSAMPTAYGSFNFTVSYKDLSLYAMFTYQLGGKVMDSNYRSLMMSSGTPSSLHKDVLKGWTVEQATATDAIDPNGIPQLNNSAMVVSGMEADLNATSSRWLTSASYLILKNVNLSYRLPKEWVRKLELEGVTLTLACENLFTKTARKGMNPQQNYAGTQSNTFVTPRVFSAGVNIKF